MAGCTKRPADARVFVVAAYHEDDSGRPAPDAPECCPRGGDGDECATARHKWRSRKTGPRHPLLVMKCRPHRVHFTIYPPGHVPYGRVPLVQLAPDGSELGDDGDIASRFADTYFEAGPDAARGDAWARECPGGTDRWWSTQLRRLRRACRVTGVEPELPPGLRERLAEVLDVDGAVLAAAVAGIEADGGYRARGRAVVSVLGALGPTWPTWWRLAEAGWLAGVWRRPVYASRGTPALLPTPFRAAVARSPPVPESLERSITEFGTC